MMNSKKIDINLVWIMFFLLLTDGVLRKWIFPGISTPIMAIKSIVALIMVLRGIFIGKINDGWSLFSISIGFIAFITTLIWGHQNLYVDFWGALNWWCGIPLCIYIVKVFPKKKLLEVLKIIFYFSILNSLVVILQFFSPISSFINRQIGNEVVEISSGENSVGSLGGMFRCSGLFGYITQASNFAPIMLASILFFLIYSDKLKKHKAVPSHTMVIITLILYIFMCVLSVSRSTIFFSIFTFLFSFCFILRKYSFRKRFISYILPLLVFCGFLLMVPQVRNSTAAISERFSTAASSTSKKNSAVGGNLEDIFNRGVLYTVDGILNPKTLDGKDIPFWGYGQGMSTQVGGRLLGLNKHAGFALAEWDSKRYIAESGVFLGLLMLICRLGFVLSFLPRVVKQSNEGSYIGVLLYPAFFINFFFVNQWGNAFLLNAAIFIGAMCILSIDKIKKNT